MAFFIQYDAPSHPSRPPTLFSMDSEYKGVDAIKPTDHNLYCFPVDIFSQDENSTERRCGNLTLYEKVADAWMASTRMIPWFIADRIKKHFQLRRPHRLSRNARNYNNFRVSSRVCLHGRTASLFLVSLRIISVAIHDPKENSW